MVYFNPSKALVNYLTTCKGDACMENIRCLISGVPQQILADIVQRIAKECKQIEVVDHTNIDRIEDFVKKNSIDVLILGMKDNVLPKRYSELIDQIKNLIVVGLIDDGRRAAVYLNNIGKNEIIQIITILGKRERSVVM